MFQGKNLLTVFLFSLLLSSGLRAEPLADSVAALRFPGRGQFGQCREFANSLSGWLSAHGQRSQIIYYAYKSGLARHSLAHAIVAWERNGQLWAMGNEAAEPRVLSVDPAERSLDLAQQYDSRAFVATRQNGKETPAALVAVENVAGAEPAPRPAVALAVAVPAVTAVPVKRIAPRPRTEAGQLSVAAPPRFYTDAHGTQYLAAP